jgi:uncharacterized protein (TIGR03437 family)
LHHIPENLKGSALLRFPSLLAVVLAVGGASVPLRAASGVSIAPGGVANAASGTSPVAPGSIAIVQGSFLLDTPVISSGSSWPANLGGLSIQFGATPAPLYYVSGSQVNFQVPWELAGSSTASLTVTAGGQTSDPQTVSIAPYAPGIFSMKAQGRSSTISRGR